MYQIGFEENIKPTQKSNERYWNLFLEMFRGLYPVNSYVKRLSY